MHFNITHSQETLKIEISNYSFSASDLHTSVPQYKEGERSGHGQCDQSTRGESFTNKKNSEANLSSISRGTLALDTFRYIIWQHSEFDLATLTFRCVPWKYLLIYVWTELLLKTGETLDGPWDHTIWVKQYHIKKRDHVTSTFNYSIFFTSPMYFTIDDSQYFTIFEVHKISLFSIYYISQFTIFHYIFGGDSSLMTKKLLW